MSTRAGIFSLKVCVAPTGGRVLGPENTLPTGAGVAKRPCAPFCGPHDPPRTTVIDTDVHDEDDLGAGDGDGDIEDDFPVPVEYADVIAPERMDADAAKVLRRLTRYGHTAFLVGGGVRDLLLERSPKDFDIATSALPQEVRRLFRNCRVIGRRFRLAHILFANGKIIEVATFRRDPSQRFTQIPAVIPTGVEHIGDPEPVRLAPVRSPDADDDVDLLIRNDNVFGEPHEDAIRRDFTINGLFYDHERGEVIDYVGGMGDLLGRVVNTVGDPDVRFREDPVRILRAIKFSARLDMGIAPEVYDAMVDHRGELARAAKPRLLEEILRLLRGGAAHRSIYLAWDTGVLAEILPEVASFLDDRAPDAQLTWGRLMGIDAAHADDRLPQDAVLLGALLLGPVLEAIEDVRDPAGEFDAFMEGVAGRLALPRRMKDRLRLVITAQRRLAAGRLGALPRRDFFADAARLFALDCEARGESIPEWVDRPSQAPDEPPPRRRRRRRRRGS